MLHTRTALAEGAADPVRVMVADDSVDRAAATA